MSPRSINVRLQANYNEKSEATKISVVEMAKAGELSPYQKEGLSKKEVSLAETVRDAAQTLILKKNNAEKLAKEAENDPAKKEAAKKAEDERVTAEKKLKDTMKKAEEEEKQLQSTDSSGSFLNILNSFLSIIRGGAHVTHKRKHRRTYRR